MDDAKRIEKLLGYTVGKVYRTPGTMRYAFYNRARIVGLKVRTHVTDDYIIVQSYTPTD